MTFKQSIKAINEAVWDTRLSMNERHLYKWLKTQNKHRHLFYIFLRRTSNWNNVSLKINQKHKR